MATSSSNTETKNTKWPITMVLTLNDTSNQNYFKFTIAAVQHINNQLVEKEAEVLQKQGIEILLHDSDTEKAYPDCKLIGLPNKNIYSSYLLRGTYALVLDRGLKPGDTVGFKYNHRLGVLLFSLLEKKDDDTKDNKEITEDSK